VFTGRIAAVTSAVLALAGCALPSEKVAPGAYALISKEEANCGFVIGREAIAVIDSRGSISGAEGVLKTVRYVAGRNKPAGEGPEPVRYLIDTTFLGSHTFGNMVFRPPERWRKMPGWASAEIIATTKTRDLMETYGAQMLQAYRRAGASDIEDVVVVSPTITFEGSAFVHLGERRLRIIETPGPSEGACAVWLEEDKVVFAGDALYVKELPWLGTADLDAWRKSLEKLEGMNALVYVPGGGALGDKEDIAALRRYLGDLEKEVHKAILSGMKPREAVEEIELPAYRSWAKYRDRLPGNILDMYRILEKRPPVPPFGEGRVEN